MGVSNKNCDTNSVLFYSLLLAILFVPPTFAIFVIRPQLVTRVTWTTVATNGIHTDLLASAIVGFTLVRLWKITYYIIIIVILALRSSSMTHIPCSAPAGKMNQSLMEWWRIISRLIRVQSWISEPSLIWGLSLMLFFRSFSVCSLRVIFRPT